MSTIQLPLGSVIKMRSLDGSRELIVTDGNRSAFAESFERIGDSNRTINGTLRGYWVSDKRSWSLSWSSLPGRSERTIEGNAGAVALKDFYRATKGEFFIDVIYANSTSNFTTRVVFESFSSDLIGRQTDDYYEVALSLTEV